MKKTILPLLLLMASACFAQRTNTFTVHFDVDKATLTTDAITTLDSFIAARSKDISIKLYGHTDIMAGYEYNDALSFRRTSAVKQYLVAKGVPQAQIIEEKGFGKRRPLNNNHGEREMYANRRVELIVEGNELETTAAVQPEISLPTGDLTTQLTDSSATVGKSFELKTMHFYGGTHVIVPQSLPILVALADVLKKHPTLEIAVEGHICCQAGGGDGYDIGTHTNSLSENRAKEICHYLNQHGILASRLQYKGMGHQFPVHPFPEKTEVEREQNRRVEIRILTK